MIVYDVKGGGHGAASMAVNVEISVAPVDMKINDKDSLDR